MPPQVETITPALNLLISRPKTVTVSGLALLLLTVLPLMMLLLVLWTLGPSSGAGGALSRLSRLVWESCNGNNMSPLFGGSSVSLMERKDRLLLGDDWKLRFRIVALSSFLRRFSCLLEVLMLLRESSLSQVLSSRLVWVLSSSSFFDNPFGNLKLSFLLLGDRSGSCRDCRLWSMNDNSLASSNRVSWEDPDSLDEDEAFEQKLIPVKPTIMIQTAKQATGLESTFSSKMKIPQENVTKARRLFPTAYATDSPANLIEMMVAHPAGTQKIPETIPGKENHIDEKKTLETPRRRCCRWYQVG